MLLEDVRYGVRLIARSPVLSCATVLTLGLGIGINTGVFTIVNGLMLRPRVTSHPETFVHLSPSYSGEPSTPAQPPWAVSVTDYRSFAAAHSLVSLAGWGIARVTIGRDTNSELALLVTCNFFHVYGLDNASMGRLFRTDECTTPGAAPVAVIGEEIWRDRFSSDPQILGATLILNRQPFTMVGMVPAGFAGRLRGPGIWLPYTMQAPFFGGADFFVDDGARWLTAEGRLRESRQAARAELTVIAQRLDARHPGRKTAMILTNGSLAEEPALRANVVWFASLIMGGLTLILLLACTNVTTLLLSRAAARRREIAIRLSVGAGRARLLRMLLTESLILSCAAGALSGWLAWKTPDIFRGLFTRTPNYPLQPDLLVFGYLAAVTIAAGLLAGSAPAAESLQVDLATALKGQESLFGGKRKHTRGFLIGAQVAMSLILLAVAGIFVRAQVTVFRADPGFETRQVMLLSLHTDMPPYTRQSAAAFDRAAAQRVAAIPGVVSVAFAGSPPFFGSDEGSIPTVEIEGTGQRSAVNTVSPDYFPAMGIGLVRGRVFGSGEPHGIVVSEAFARTFFAGRDPLGQTVRTTRGELFEVAGVARDVKSQRFGLTDGPLLYRPRAAQAYGDTLVARFRGPAAPVADAVRAAIRDLDREMMPAPTTLQFVIDSSAEQFRQLSQMILFVGVIAILLAVIGMYGVAAFAVSRRTREMGIRVALGATRSNIVATVLRSGMRPVALGIAAGVVLSLASSLALAQILRQLPFALKLRDPIIYGAVSLILAFTAFGATLGPALRASKADPMQALRQD